MATEFQKQQFEEIYPKGIEHHYWNNSRNIHIKNTLKRFKLDQHPTLEIGCGRGVVVDYLRQNNINCQGVELAENSLDNSCNYLHYGTDALKLPEDFRNNIKVILLLDVIEHLEDPADFLEKIKTAFPSAGHYLITVPARMEIWSNFDEFNNHFLRYNISKLQEDTASLVGESLYTSYLYRLLYIPARLLKALNKNRNTEIKAPQGSISKLAHKIISIYFVIENKLRLFNLPGTSLITLIKV